MPNVKLKNSKIENRETNKPITHNVKKIERNKKGESNMKNVIKILTMSVGLMLALNNADAVAVGTPANTDITNQASIAFKVSGVIQTAVPSNTTTFKVDKKVSFTVSEIAPIGATTVVPGQACGGAAGCAVLTFQVNNQGNYTADYLLQALNAAAGDNFDATGATAYVESGATAGFQTAEDTDTYINNLASGDSIVVYIIGTIPASTINGSGVCTAVCNGNTAKLHLLATGAVETGTNAAPGVALTGTAATTADTAGAVDVIFADAAGTAPGDVAFDGKHSDDDDYSVQTATLSIVKTAFVIWDPFNCTGTAAGLTPSITNTKDASCGSNEPKRIPGAVIHYQMAITNGGANPADDLSLSDTISSDQTYLAGTIFVDGTAEDDNSTGVDDTPINGGNPTGGNISGAVVTGNIFALPAAATKNIHFNVTIN
jgi:uncharacterized repeat protein (TIGR01451 family)